MQSESRFRFRLELKKKEAEEERERRFIYKNKKVSGFIAPFFNWN